MTDVCGETDLVGDDHQCPALQSQVPDDAQDLADQLGVERRGGLVEQHHLRLEGEGARDPDPLLLAAGELAGIGVGAIGEAHLLEQTVGHRSRHRRAAWPCTWTGPSITFSRAVMCGNRLCDWKTMPLRARSARIWRAALTLVARYVAEVDCCIGDPHRTGVRGLQDVERAQDGGLPRPGRTEQGRHGAFLGGEVDVTQDLVLPEGLSESRRPRSAGRAPGSSRSCHVPSQSPLQAEVGRGRPGSRPPSSRAPRRRRAARYCPLTDAATSRLAEQLRYQHHRGQGGVLDQREQLVGQRRNGDPSRLGQHDPPHRLP